MSCLYIDISIASILPSNITKALGLKKKSPENHLTFLFFFFLCVVFLKLVDDNILEQQFTMLDILPRCFKENDFS